ncbi:soluble lytic murein transglycosylase [Natronincola peptidivorans]|uniref:Soluble lytic murein transglycosylase n=1 Tax=Natronincola peptidivorans TaxID=426128 RepID=A0A1I0GU56_9FIRM|nr:lytic transglycosylase domain-containing protein [Natronincola peptidivorans]SET73914.1 soluble lytic murein transglycosylase [Natronincola peptidivorans]
MKKLIWTLVFLLFFLTLFILVQVFPLGTTLVEEHTEANTYLQYPASTIEKLDFLEMLRKDSTEAGEKTLKALAEEVTAIGYMANLVLAEKYEEKGEDPVAFYQRALELYETKAIQLKLAEALHLRGDSQEAMEIYVRLMPDDGAMHTMIQMDIEDSVMVDILLEGNHLDTALYYIEEVISDISKKDLSKEHALALARYGDYNHALSLMEEIMETSLQDSDFRWWYGRSLEAVGRKNEAMEIYKGIGKAGAYRLGILLEEMGQVEEAAAAFIQSDLPISRWRGARILDNIGKHEEAFKVYVELTQEESSYQEDAAYRAYVLQNQLNKPIDHQLLKVLEDSPAWMKSLGKEPSWQMLDDVTPQHPVFLDIVQEYEAAEEYQMAAIEQAIGEKYATNEEKLGLGYWYQQQRDYFMAVRWGIRALREKPSPQAYQLTYQKPFEKEVLAAAEEFQIDPYLIWAVMREESHYRPDVFSWAGAQGLMQIMPATGADIASRLKTSYADKDMLDPEKNIRFGAFYLRSMLDMFSGDLDKALAAYNGGPGNVRKWSMTSIGATPEGFPTSIVFMETRQYITKVKNSYYTYLWLYHTDEGE